MEKQYLEYGDFYLAIWGNIPSRIVNEDYILNNREFIDNITYDLYRLYEMDETLSLRVIIRTVESFFFNLNKFKPNNVKKS